MIKKTMKLLVTVVFLCLVSLFTLGQEHVQASQNLPWWISSYYIDSGHDFVEMEVNGITKAGTVTAYIEIEGNLLERKVVLNGKYWQTIRLELDKRYSRETPYMVYFEDEEGNRLGETEGYLMGCDMPFIDCNINPKMTTGNIQLFNRSNVKEIKAKIGSVEYNGIINASGDFIIEYPRQDVGNNIQIIASCGLGCEDIFKTTIKNDYIRNKSFTVKMDKIVIYERLEADETFYAQIGNKIYEGKKGTGSAWNIAVSYPLQPVGTKVACWIETENGSRSEVREATISRCEISLSGNVNIFPNNLTGYIWETSGEKNEYVIVQIGDKKYRGDVSYQYGYMTFKVQYPSQKKGQKMKVTAYDGHGCASVTMNVTLEAWKWSAPKLLGGDLFANHCNYTLDSGERICVRIGGKNYYSKYASMSDQDMTVSFPVQKIGTSVTCWLENNNGKYSDTVTKKILDPKIKLKSSGPKANCFTGSIRYTNDKMYTDDVPKVKSVTIVVGKKTYKKEYTKAVSKVSFTYPKQKIGTKVKVTLTDENGYKFIQTLKIKNDPIKLNVNRIKYGQNKLTGTTKAKSKVIVTIGKKNYKVNANARGKFTVKIPYQREGQKIKVKTVDSHGYYNSETLYVDKVYGSVHFENLLYESTRTVNLTAKNVFKGEKILVVINGTTYTCKINKDAKTFKAGLNIGSHGAGSSVRIILCDKFGYIRNELSTQIYIGDNIYVGMPAYQAELTTWGKPDRRNQYGDIYQWVFVGKYTTLYVYIQNGVVISVQRINY